MGNKINDPIVRLMGLRYKSHPVAWFGYWDGCAERGYRIHRDGTDGHGEVRVG